MNSEPNSMKVVINIIGIIAISIILLSIGAAISDHQLQKDQTVRYVKKYEDGSWQIKYNDGHTINGCSLDGACNENR